MFFLLKSWFLFGLLVQKKMVGFFEENVAVLVREIFKRSLVLRKTLGFRWKAFGF